jgi:hypothetical protein
METEHCQDGLRKNTQGELGNTMAWARLCVQLPDDAVTAVTLNDFGEEEELTDGDLVFNHSAQTELQMSTMRFKCRILPRHAQRGNF